jgi:hypothetical protein
LTKDSSTSTSERQLEVSVEVQVEVPHLGVLPLVLSARNSAFLALLPGHLATTKLTKEYFWGSTGSCC